MKKILLLFIPIFVFRISASAVEGMWIPSLIEMFHSDMKTYGLKLNPEEIYSTNQSSLKDAIIQFNGGCTAEIVSEEGLILTNHHCGYDAIQKHSSVENDYLKKGFWAKSKEEEKACPWMYVTFVKEIRDVTEGVFEGVTDKMSASEKSKKIEANIKKIQEAAKDNSDFTEAVIKPFNQGNQYYMLITEDFKDIRLVGTPPNAIGKYGGDTDNWVWPRHTGDFSVFRIYANKENKPAEYDEANQPYDPDYSLAISLKPKQVGDFTMVYGFPGSTDQHYPSRKLQFYMETERPARIKMRQTSLDIIKPAMNENDTIFIQYASKQARIANAWKKWIGQLGGLRELHALEKKQEWEASYKARAEQKPEWNEKYGDVIENMNKVQAEYEKYEMAYAMFIEYFYVGPEFINYASEFFSLYYEFEKLDAEGGLKEETERVKKHSKSFFKNYNKNIDRKRYVQLTPLYIKYVDNDLLPESMITDWEDLTEGIFEKSVLLNPEKLNSFLDKFSKKSVKKLGKDPAFKFVQELYIAFIGKVRGKYVNMLEKEEALFQLYVEGLLEMFPEKKVWPDANSTMRIAYGKIDGSAPYDGMQYTHYTTIDGIMQKHDPSNPDFFLTDRFIDLYNEGDYGGYDQDGELWVCFTASNHTTGGNSGSPVLDAEGRLIGINFDRSWESTMSDFMFDESRCRNIIVDIRYVLWVIDKYGEASHLIEEMNIVR